MPAYRGAASARAVFLGPKILVALFAVVVIASGFSVGWGPHGPLASPPAGSTLASERGTGGPLERSVGHGGRAVAGFSSSASAAHVAGGCPENCVATFVPQGLPAGKSAEIAVAGYDSGALVQVRGSSISIPVANGTVYYVILGPAGYSVDGGRSAGNVTMAGENVTVVVPFVQKATANLTVAEKGLPTGTRWCWTLAHALTVCTTRRTSRAENFSLGIYAINFTSVPGLPQFPPLTSSGADLSHGSTRVTVYYIPARFPFYVSGTGLPPGYLWRITMVLTSTSPSPGPARARMQDFGNGSGGFALGNGTYSYRVHAPGFRAYTGCPLTCAPAGSGSFTIAGGPAYLNLTFRVATYTLTFTERGLTPGLIWGISLYGTGPGSNITTVESSTSTVLIPGVPNGSYTYSIITPAGFHSRIQGHVTVHGPKARPIGVSFRPEPAAGAPELAMAAPPRKSLE